MTKHFIIFGAPGSGKGTQAKKLVKHFGLNYLGTGDLMRIELNDKTDLGKKIKDIIESGGLVDNQTANELVDQALKNLRFGSSVIFDGYPRTLNQVEHLQDYFNATKSKVFVLNLKVDSKNLIERISTRRVCQNCKKIFQNPAQLKIKKCDECHGDLILREDDKPDVVKERLAVYNDQTKPLIDFYKNLKVLIEIDGNPPIDEVADEIELKVKKIFSDS